MKRHDRGPRAPAARGMNEISNSRPGDLRTVGSTTGRGRLTPAAQLKSMSGARKKSWEQDISLLVEDTSAQEEGDHMLRRSILSGGLAFMGTVSFTLAMVLPIFLWVPIVGPVSAWAISPLICSAVIAFVAFAASFPLWCSKRRAWLVPFIVSCIILVPALAVFYGFILEVVSSQTGSYSLLSFGGSGPVSLIPAYLFVISFSMMLAGSMAARKIRDPLQPSSK
jgi:hypothetical protein